MDDKETLEKVYAHADACLYNELIMLALVARETESTYSGVLLHQAIFCICALASERMENHKRTDTKIYDSLQFGMRSAAEYLIKASDNPKVNRAYISAHRCALNENDYQILVPAWDKAVATIGKEK